MNMISIRIFSTSLLGKLSKYSWSNEEDKLLTEQFAIYAGSASVFTSIAQHPQFK